MALQFPPVQLDKDELLKAMDSVVQSFNETEL